MNKISKGKREYLMQRVSALAMRQRYRVRNGLSGILIIVPRERPSKFTKRLQRRSKTAYSLAI